jgi:phospholipid/cholesterol/gamma-HCH transport system permease protein
LTPAEVGFERDPSGAGVLTLRGRLDSETTGSVWNDAVRAAETSGSADLVVDASGLDYLDGSGASLLVALREQQEGTGGGFSIRGLRDEFAPLLELVAPSEEGAQAHAQPRDSFFVSLGRSTFQLFADLRYLVAFVGELTVMLARGLRHPRQIRFKDVWLTAERAGNGAVPIIVASARRSSSPICWGSRSCVSSGRSWPRSS